MREEWVYIDSAETMDKLAEGYRIRHLEWNEPGWYWNTVYNQKCPRGCCYDHVIKFISATGRVDELKHKIIAMAHELNTARHKEIHAIPSKA